MRTLATALLILFTIAPQVSIAESDIAKSLSEQMKGKFEKSCSNNDYLGCLQIDAQVCNSIAQGELGKLNDIIDANLDAIAKGDFKQLLSEIKDSRTQVLESNGVDVENANTCGKEHLQH